jgi:bifunctional ADP-heptose synthase (sugar kinase/adenylyltransferase)
VDKVVIFDELTPDRVIEAVRPDVFVKGGDYRDRSLPEATTVEACGGRVVIVDHVPDRSTSGLLQRVRGIPV